MTISEKTKKILRRFLWLMVPFGIQLFYFPLNRYSSGGIAPITVLDHYIPLWPLWTAPYVLVLPAWILAYAWAGLKMDDHLFKPFLWASIGAILTGILTFWLFPTYIVRPEVTGSGFAWDWIRQLYASDHVYNALPSGHAYVTGIIAIFWVLWKPRLKWLWIFIYGVVLLSTLFTHQHYILDLIAGMGLAAGASFVSLRLTNKKSSKSILSFASSGNQFHL